MISRLQTIAAALVIFLLPFLVWPVPNDVDTTFLSAKLWGAFILGNICLSFLISKKTHWSLGLFHLCLSISTLKSWYEAESLYPFLYWLAAIGFSLFFLSIEKVQQRTILLALIGSACLVSCHALIQRAGYDPGIQHGPGARYGVPIGLFRQHTLLASFLAPVACLAFGMGLWIPAALIGLVVLLTHSLFSIAGMIAGILVALRQWSLLAICGAASVLYLYVYRFTGIDKCRFPVWGAALDAWWDGPRFWGFGIGSFGRVFPTQFQPASTYDCHFFTEAHNDLIQGAFAGGLVLLIPALAVLLSSAKRIYLGTSAGAAAALTCLFVNAQGSYPMQLSPQFLLAVLFGTIILNGDCSWIRAGKKTS